MKNFLDPDIDEIEDSPGGELSEEDLRILKETGMAEELERQVNGEPRGTLQ